MKVVNYETILCMDLTRLDDEVRELVQEDDNWEPLGAASTYVDVLWNRRHIIPIPYIRRVFVQTMIKREETK